MSTFPSFPSWVVVSAILGALVLVGGTTEAQVVAKPDFSGLWELDDSKSEDAPEAIRIALGKTGGRGGKQQQRQMLSSRLNYLAYASETIEISQTSQDFTLINTEDDVRIHYIDGEKHTRQSPAGEMMTTVTTWRDDRLAATTEGKEIGKISETFGYEGHQLVHIVRIQHKLFEEDLVVRTHYNRLDK